VSDIRQLKVIAFPGAPNLPIFAAQQNGYFAEEGIEVELTTTPSSVFQFEKLSTGDFDIAMTAFDNVVAYREGQGAAKLEGAGDFHVLMGATQIELAFVTAPDVKSYADIKGRTIALDALATGFAFVLYEMLARGGLSPDDSEMVPVGATPDRRTSGKAGTPAGTLTIDPFTSSARSAGFQVLDLSTALYSAYQGGVVAASRAWAAHNEDLVTAYLRGYLKGLAWSLDPENRAAGAVLLLMRMPAIKPGVVDAVLDSLLSPRTGLSPKGEVLRDGMQTVLDLRSKYGGGAKLNDIDRYLDLACYEGVVATGKQPTYSSI
jgi:ABC-type nitrate/sulfonate/bicarbonate transport system substrate-binding protein